MNHKTMKLHDLYKKSHQLQDGEIILDVRNPDEYNQVRIKGSLNIPLPELESRYEELKKFKTVFIHCKRGGRAKTALQFLQSKGLPSLICVDDAGIDLWVESGYPVDK